MQNTLQQKMTKPKIKKCGSLEEESDRSLSPGSEVKENKPNIQRINPVVRKPNIHRITSVSNRGLSKSAGGDPIKTGISQAKSRVTKTCKTKAVPTKPTKTSSTRHASKLTAPIKKHMSPRAVIDRPVKSATVPAKTTCHLTNNCNSKPSTPTKCLSPKSPSKSELPLWKIPASTGFGNPHLIRPLPGRGGPKKPKKVYNPPSLFSLCKCAVQSVIRAPEVAEDTKDFVKRRMYSQALISTIWTTLTKETKKNRISIETLISERDTLSAELRELKATLNTQITSLTQQHYHTLTITTQQLTDKHDKLTKSLKEGYETTIADLRSQLSTIEERHQHELCAVRDVHVQEMRKLHSDHENQQNQLISDHQTHVTQLEQTQRDLEEQNDHLDNVIKEKDENMKYEVEHEVKKQVQRYANINAELQSLRDVIDIKKEENRRLQIDHAEFALKNEEIKRLKHEMGGLRDTNEQLRATIEMKTESERNMNITQESLKLELSIREKDTKNVAHKFEELQYKLSTYEEILAKNNLHDPKGGLFSPSFYSTPLGSPRLADNGERHFINNMFSTPRGDKIDKHRPKMCLFEAEDVETELLPIED